MTERWSTFPRNSEQIPSRSLRHGVGRGRAAADAADAGRVGVGPRAVPSPLPRTALQSTQPRRGTARQPVGGGGMKVERKHLTAAMQRVPHWSGVVMFIPLPMSCDAKNSGTSRRRLTDGAPQASTQNSDSRPSRSRPSCCPRGRWWGTRSQCSCRCTRTRRGRAGAASRAPRRAASWPSASPADEA